MYPNPTANTFSIELNEYQGKDYTVRVSDIIGKVIYTQESNSELLTLDLNLKNGIYTVEIIVDNKRIVDKILVQK